MKQHTLLIAMGTAFLSLSACSDGPSGQTDAPVATAENRLSVDGASVALAANSAAPSAAYFTIHGGPEASKLTGIISADAERIELHESRSENGVTSMAAVPSVDVPAGGEVRFRQGGLHAMVFGIKPEATTAGKISMTLLFEGGRNIVVEAPLAAVAGGAAAHDMSAMEHDSGAEHAQPEAEQDAH